MALGWSAVNHLKVAVQPDPLDWVGFGEGVADGFPCPATSFRVVLHALIVH